LSVFVNSNKSCVCSVARPDYTYLSSSDAVFRFICESASIMTTEIKSDYPHFIYFACFFDKNTLLMCYNLLVLALGCVKKLARHEIWVVHPCFRALVLDFFKHFNYMKCLYVVNYCSRAMVFNLFLICCWLFQKSQTTNIPINIFLQWINTNLRFYVHSLLNEKLVWGTCPVAPC